MRHDTGSAFLLVFALACGTFAQADKPDAKKDAEPAPKPKQERPPRVVPKAESLIRSDTRTLPDGTLIRYEVKGGMVHLADGRSMTQEDFNKYLADLSAKQRELKERPKVEAVTPAEAPKREAIPAVPRVAFYIAGAVVLLLIVLIAFGMRGKHASQSSP